MNSILSLPDLADYLQLPRKWLRDAAFDGRIPSLKIGRRLVFNTEAVQGALASLAAQTKGGEHVNR